MQQLAQYIVLGAADPSGRILVLLLASHVVSDFLFQTESLARRKRTHAWLMVLHGAIVLVAHVLVLWPYMTSALLGCVAIIAVLHTVQDKVRAGSGWPPGPRGFCFDQALHVAVTLTAWYALVASGSLAQVVFSWGEMSVRLHMTIVLIVAGYALNWTASTRLVALILEDLCAKRPEDMRVGRAIGIVERLAIYTLALLGQWVTVGLVVAAKSIRKPKNTDDEDYYLLGTLLSVFCAILIAIAVRALVWR